MLLFLGKLAVYGIAADYQHEVLQVGWPVEQALSNHCAFVAQDAVIGSLWEHAGAQAVQNANICGINVSSDFKG